MDIVITYVNGLDPEWLADYSKHTNTPIMEKRFRDWGTLPYLFRGIERNMPFINNVFLVVSQKSQIPAWVNTDNIRIVLHRDFIPEEFLPTFNCNPLELYMHRIEGLDEQFLYFNDDMFPMLPCKPEDFYDNGRSIIHFYKHFFTGGNMYKHICKNSDTAARSAAGVKPSTAFIRPQHICSPMQKTASEEVFSIMEEKIRNSISITRTADNFNQYLFMDYLYYKGLVKDSRLSNKHISVALASPRSIAKRILHPKHKLMCINDVHLRAKHYEVMRKAILDAFEEYFPQKSKYEL